MGTETEKDNLGYTILAIVLLGAYIVINYNFPLPAELHNTVSVSFGSLWTLLLKKILEA